MIRSREGACKASFAAFCLAILGAGAAAVSAPPGALGEAAKAGGASGEWAAALNSKSRLIAGRAAGGLYAGVEIAMEPGWKTYWRFPGPSGVPPEFDFTASENLRSAEVLYPAPHRLKDPKADDAIGYKDHVIFPVALAAADPGKPIVLRGKITYGVCKDLCVPAELDVELDVPADVAGSPQIEGVLTKVPVSAPASDAPTLKAWRLIENGGKPVLQLDVASTDAATADIFLVPPEGLYLALPQPIGAERGIAKFSLDLTDGVDVKDVKGKSIDAVVVDAKGQSRTSIKLE